MLGGIYKIKFNQVETDRFLSWIEVGDIRVMTILSIEEFNQKSRSGDNGYEKIYQERTVVPGLAFSVTQMEAAQQY